MIGRTPDNITAIRPLKDGVIADFDATEQMLRFFIEQVHRRRYFAKPRMVICAPSGITPVEQRAVKEGGLPGGSPPGLHRGGPPAAAIGAGLPVHEATGNMVVDVGGGTTEVAVISLGGVVTSLSIRTAGDDLDQAIAGLDEEGALPAAGRADRRGGQDDPVRPRRSPSSNEPEAEIRGRDHDHRPAPHRRGLQRRGPAGHGGAAARRSSTRSGPTLDQTPPELAGDIMDRGIVLTGGCALLRGLDERLRHETGMPVHVAEDPLVSVAKGCGPVRRGVRGAAAGAGLGVQRRF